MSDSAVLRANETERRPWRSETTVPATWTGRAGLWLLAALALLAWISILLLQPPAAVPASAPATEFSSERAFAHVQAIAAAPRSIGTPAHAAAREYIVQQLTALGLQPEIQETPVINQFMGTPLSAGTVRNIVARIEGSGDGKAIMLVSHYDSVLNGPGANDNGTPVAALLETARALTAGSQLRNDVVLLFTDGEETGLLGSKAYVDANRAADVGVVLNLEARGSAGPVLMFETSDQNGWLIQNMAAAGANPIASSLFYEIYKILPNSTDFTVFRRAQLAGLNFAYIDGPKTYESPIDNVGNVDQRVLQHHGYNALQLARQFGNLDLSNPRAADMVYFNPIGRLLVVYPAALALPIALVTLIVVIVALVIGFRRRALRVRGLIAGLLMHLLSMIIVPLFVALIWQFIRLIHSQYRLMLTSESYSAGAYMLSLLVLTIAMTSLLYLWYRRRVAAGSLIGGGLLWWTLLMIATSLALPGASYFFTWPLLFAAIGVAVLWARGERLTLRWRWAILALSALPAVVLLSPTLYLIVVSLGLTMMPVAILLIVLVLALLMPQLIAIVPWAKGENNRAFPGVAFMASLLLLGYASFSSGFSPANPRPSSLMYGLNADTGAAQWLSVDGQPDQFTTQFFGATPQRGTAPEFLPNSTQPVMKADAPAIEAAAPQVEVLDDTVDGELRRLRLRITSPRQSPTLSIYADPALDVRSVEIEGQRAQTSEIPAILRRDPRWMLDYRALPPEGIEMTLEVANTPEVALTVIDRSVGLPEIQGVSTARPDGFMIAPAVAPTRGLENSTFVSKTFRIGGQN